MLPIIITLTTLSYIAELKAENSLLHPAYSASILVVFEVGFKNENIEKLVFAITGRSVNKDKVKAIWNFQLINRGIVDVEILIYTQF